MRHPWASPLLFVFVLAACQAVGAKKVNLDQEFTLAPGRVAELDGQGFTVKLIGVIEDSRCPLGLTCIWAGQAAVRLGFRSSQEDVIEGQEVAVEDYRVIVLKVNPEPVKGRKISPAEYRVTLKVLAAQRSARYLGL
jgi:hypothetical protein